MGMTIEGKENASLQNNSFPHTVYVLQNAYCTVYRYIFFRQRLYELVWGAQVIPTPNMDF
jgi:hypothetical protein